MKTKVFLFIAVLLVSLPERLSAQWEAFEEPVLKSYMARYSACTNYPDSTLYFLNKMEARLIQINKPKSLPVLCGLKAAAYGSLGKYDLQLSYAMKGLNMARENKDSASIGNLYIALSEVYIHYVLDLPLAEKYYLMVERYLDHTDTANYIRHLYNGGQLYSKWNKFPESYRLLNKALSLSSNTKDENMQAMLLGVMATNATDCRECEKALEYRNKTIDIYTRREDYLGMAIEYNGLGYLHINCLHEPQKAIGYLKKAEELWDKYDIPLERKSLWQAFADAYGDAGNYQLAYKYQRLSMIARDSLLEKEQIATVAGLEAKYAGEYKESQIKNLRLQEKEQAKSTRLVYGALGLAVLLLAAGTLAYRNNRKYSKLLSKEGERKGLLLEEVHHRINNSLQITGALLSMQATTAIGDEAREVLRQSEARIHAMATMHGLLNTTADTTEIPILPYLSGILQFHIGVLSEKDGVEVQTSVPDTLFPASLALPLGLIVNELVTNAIKYAFPATVGGVVKVELRQLSKNDWEMQVSDNGIGLNTSQPGGNKSSKLGLRVVNILTRQLNGTLTTPTVEKGSRFILSFTS